MSVNEIGNAPGAWNLSLKESTPRNVWDGIDYFGRIVIVSGRMDPALYGDNLLTEARYVGVVRHKDVDEGSMTLSGPGMVVWLGDEDNKGPVIETTLAASGSSFADAVRDVLSVQTSITEGTLHSVPGTASYSYLWKSAREALNSLCDIYGTPTFPVEYRVNGDGTLDAGRVADLYDTTPSVILLPKNTGYDLDLLALPSRFTAQQDVEDFTTRAVAFSQGEGEAITTAAKNLTDIGRTNPYLGLDGNPIQITRMIDASDTENANLANLAAQQLGRFASTNDVLSLSTIEYDISGDVTAGDYVYAYDPDAGLVDTSVEVYFRGQRINPVVLRVLETTWPVTKGMTVAYRHNDGTWLDLTDYVVFESAGDTSLKVAGFDRALTSGTTLPPGERINGDTSVPATPVFGTFVGTTYQANGDETKAQIVVTWTEPLNQDGSTIVDGDHYEIRYRPNVTAPYAATWNEAAQDTWNELYTWNQPRVAAITSTDWQTVIAPWDTDTYRVQELTPSVVYEFQIRAVDFASPPNQSAWSATTSFEAPRDTLPPSTPAAPLVAGSRIAIQVVHQLGVAAGGTFNLEADTNHLEVHVSNNDTFLPDDSTIVGRLLCAAALQSGIPVVGTFPVEETTTRYVKVVAVDRSGNKSNPSEASSASVLLIDDAHISDLTVSKVTAGTITADWILAAAIKTASSGQRVELNTDGLQAYGTEGDQTINLSADPLATGNYITFTQGDTSVASIDQDGNISGQNVNVNANLVIDGLDFIDDYYDPLSKGRKARGDGTDNVTGAGANTWKGYVQIAFTAEAGRRYQVTFRGRAQSTAANDRVEIGLYANNDGTPPTLSSSLFWSDVIQLGAANTDFSVEMKHEREFDPGDWSLLIGFRGISGTATMHNSLYPYQLWVDEVGPAIDSTSALNDGGVATPTPKTYTKTYTATWSGTYAENNTYTSFYGNDVNQGRYDSTWGNQRGLIGFNAATIQSDLAGATINSIKVTLNAKHWYYNTGGTALIGAHDYTSRPSTWSDSRVDQAQVTVTNWPKPGKKTVSLPVSIGNEFRDGTTAGISLGPGTDTNLIYYGRFDGVGSSNVPTLTITYTV